MNKQRRTAIEEIGSELMELIGRISDLRDEEEVAYENLPESFQMGERGDAMQDAINGMDEAIDSLNEAISALEEATDN